MEMLARHKVLYKVSIVHKYLVSSHQSPLDEAIQVGPSLLQAQPIVPCVCLCVNLGCCVAWRVLAAATVWFH